MAETPRLAIQFFTSPKEQRKSRTHVVDLEEGYAICGYYPPIGHAPTTVSEEIKTHVIECSLCLKRLARKFYSPEGIFIG